jgi:type IV secretory pathway VirB2 component (pilin)
VYGKVLRSIAGTFAFLLVVLAVVAAGAGIANPHNVGSRTGATSTP